MGKPDQIVERDEKPVFKIFLVFIGLIILTNIIISIMNIFTDKIPYITTLSTIVLVVVSCTFILMKYFSKYAYVYNEDSLIFYRLIGKRKFHMLTIGNKDLIYIKPITDDEKNEKYPYKFIFSENEDQVFIGEFKGHNNEREKFLFSPDEDILKRLKNKEWEYGRIIVRIFIPHPPIIVEEIGRAEEKKALKIVEGCKVLAENIEKVYYYLI